ncbi:glycine, alanine and asparagine-rich protein [Drosophila nasuta]|uniref:glycine, alanine and asparagine-rich protein n=1 Tax=Drosophila nasuta TaxID=42062 RepID=UPI00295E7739|nr:glycine, alanine and asparagine-rich protein [Drosophila nasuta]
MYSKPSRNLMQLLLLATLATSGCMASESSDKTLPKRSLGDSSIPWASTSSAQLGAGVGWNAGGGGGAGGWSSGGWSGGHSPLKTAPSPNEVANAISAAKQASANVLIAQQQMQAAKENVLNQQRIAMEKETHAAILTQKSEAAAAIQRSEAASAASAVVLAQQRLAASKAAVAYQQRIAAAREAEAASALQRSAHAAAAEIQKSEYEASKFGQFTRNGNAGAAHHLTIIKDTALSPITAGTNHVTNLESLGLGPWLSGNSVGKASAASSWL